MWSQNWLISNCSLTFGFVQTEAHKKLYPPWLLDSLASHAVAKVATTHSIHAKPNVFSMTHAITMRGRSRFQSFVRFHNYFFCYLMANSLHTRQKRGQKWSFTVVYFLPGATKSPPGLGIPSFLFAFGLTANISPKALESLFAHPPPLPPQTLLKLVTTGLLRHI